MNEFLQAVRAGLEEGLTKEASMTDSKQKFIDDTIRELEKEASLMSFLDGAANSIREGQTAGQLMASSAMQSAGKVLPPLALGLGVAAAARALSGMGNMMDRRAFEKALALAVQRSPILREMDKEKLRMFADSIYTHAPTVAQDPVILANILTNAAHSESLDMNTIRTLIDMEQRKHSERSIKAKDLSL